MYLLGQISLFFVIGVCMGMSIPKVAIVGGGIGGTSCAYFLRELFAKNASITLFERDTIGGRLATINVDGDYYEAGGSVIHPKNKYMSDFANLLGLSRRKAGVGLWGIYNGEEFVFKTSPWAVATLAKMFWRYGWNVFHLDTLLKVLLNDFSRIYDAQDKGLAFTSVQNLLAHMNPKFPNMTQLSLVSFMKKNGFTDPFISELVQAVMLVNYGQTTNINAFVGVVSLAGSESGLWSVKGGNKEVPVGLLEKSDARFINADVTIIQLKKDGTFKLTYKLPMPGNLVTESFDFVIIATPLIYNFKNIKFQNFTKDLSKYEGVYHRTVATFVQGGKVKNFLFHTSDLPDAIFTNNDTFLFNSLSKSFPVTGSRAKGKRDVYKIFSKVPLAEEQISELFANVGVVNSKDWLAYPHYGLPEYMPPFMLFPGLYYTNAIEWSASAMEMSAIAGRNVALLLYNTWTSRLNLIDVTKKYYKDEL